MIEREGGGKEGRNGLTLNSKSGDERKVQKHIYERTTSEFRGEVRFSFHFDSLGQAMVMMRTMERERERERESEEI